MHPVVIALGPVTIYSYGLLVALGGVASVLFWRSRARRMGFPDEEGLWTLVNAIIAGGFIGGRALFLLEYTRPFGPDFWAVFFSLSKGYSVLGAFLGVTAGVAWACRRAGAPLLRTLDYVCMAAPVWHAIGRLGCFLAGCCHGRPADGLPWAVRFTDPRALVPPELLGRPLHPAQLYEAAADLLLAAALYAFALRPLEAGRARPGILAASYLAGYGALRFSLEFVRGDAVPLAAGLSLGQALSLVMIAAAAALLLGRRAACSRS